MSLIIISGFGGGQVAKIEQDDLNKYIEENPNASILDSLDFLYKGAKALPCGIEAQYLTLIRRNIHFFDFVLNTECIMNSTLESISKGAESDVTIQQIISTEPGKGSYEFIKEQEGDNCQSFIENTLKCRNDIEAETFAGAWK